MFLLPNVLDHLTVDSRLAGAILDISRHVEAICAIVPANNHISIGIWSTNFSEQLMGHTLIATRRLDVAPEKEAVETYSL